MNIENIKPKQLSLDTAITEKIHIRLQQRNGKKSTTFIEGLDSYLDQKKMALLLTKVKVLFGCGGAIIKNDENLNKIQLSGDQREKVSEYLIKSKIVEEENIIMHGY